MIFLLYTLNYFTFQGQISKLQSENELMLHFPPLTKVSYFAKDCIILKQRERFVNIFCSRNVFLLYVFMLFVVAQDETANEELRQSMVTLTLLFGNHCRIGRTEQVGSTKQCLYYV